MTYFQFHPQGSPYRRTRLCRSLSHFLASRPFGLALICLLGPFGIATAQTVPQSPDQKVPTQPAPDQKTSDQQAASTTLSVEAKLVSLPVTVRDKHGAIVRNLAKENFTLLQDGHPQAIKYFSQDTNLALTLGLLVDTSMSQRNVLDEERNASKSFIDQMLTVDKDKAFLIHFDREVELLQDLTSSKPKLQAGLQLLQASAPGRDDQPSYPGDPNSGSGSGSGSDDTGSHGHHVHGGTLLYDSIYLASNELMKKQTGRKAVVILSDGVDRGSKESLTSAIESAQRADTVVYSILFKDKHEEDNNDRPHNGGMGRQGGGGGWPGSGGGGWPGNGGGGMGRGGNGGGRGGQEIHEDGKKVLERISRETGGRMYEVSKKETVDQIYTSIAEELRTQYLLGYTPDKDIRGEGYHRITLTINEKDDTVRTRDGYYEDH